jgi:hypothetical protein
LTSQQLIEARAALWHHNANPILTLEEAASWVATTGFLLFLPRRQQLRAPSPTFVEATMGRLEHTPGRPEIENALSLANRLYANGDVLPLNLLGTLSEEPDFLIARDRLPWLLSLRGDRHWKTAPGGRTSPLNISVWKLLDEQGELTTEEIRSGVGRDVTEASVRRALIDLWTALRVFPIYHEGEETSWALAKTVCPKECTKGVTTAQNAALSLFLADYLRSAIAVTEDEAAAFLSPLASRSKLREVLHALTATRQLSTIPLGPNTLYYVAGELPEFPEIAAPEPTQATSEEAQGESEHETSPTGERIRKYTPRTPSRESYQRPEREGGFKPRREGEYHPREDREFQPRRQGGFQSRQEGGYKPPYRKPRPVTESGSDAPESGRPERESRSFGEERPHPPFRKPFGERKSFGERKPYGERPERKSYGDRKPYGRSSEGEGERKSFGPRKPFGERKSYGERPERKSYGDRKPYGRSSEGEGERKSFGPRKPYGRSSEGEGERKSFGPRKPFGERKSYGERPERKSFGERKPYGRSSEGEGERKSFGPRKSYGDRPERKSFGERKSYGDRPERKSFGERKPYGRSSEGDGERKSFGPRKPYGDRPERKSFGERKPYGDRPAFRKDRDAEDRPRRDAESSDRPPRKTYGKPGGFSKSGSKPGFKSGAKSGSGGFSNGPAKKFGKSSGPKKSYGKPGGKSGFSKGPGKSFGKGPKRGPGKPRRSE